MDYYERNLKYFEKREKGFHDLVVKGVPLNPIMILNVEDNSVQNIIVEGKDFRCFVNSIYNIDREMNEMFKDVEIDVETVIVFGVGGGYVFDYMADKFKCIERIILIEPELDVFRSFLQKYDIEKLTKRFKLIDFVVNIPKEDAVYAIGKIITDIINTKIKFVSHISYRTISIEYFEYLSKQLSKYISTVASDANIGNSVTYKKIINTLYNIKSESYPVKELMDKMKGKPVILVSAGPSLNKNMHILEEAKNKAFIIAVGSAVSILDANGITPHLRAAFTPHEAEIKVFNVLKDKSIPLIFTDMLYHDVVSSYEGKKFRMAEHNNNLSRYIYQKSDIENTYVFTELTVANTIFELLCMAGCREIIFVGQDMAFTDKQQYGKGAWIEIKVNDEASGNYIVIKDIYGDDTLTMKAFILVKEAFEKRIKVYENAGIKFYNATEGGLNIDGTNIVKLHEKIDSLPEIGDINSIISSAMKDDADNTEKLKNVFEDMEKELSEIRVLNDKRIKKLQELIIKREKGLSSKMLLKYYEKINTIEHKLKAINMYENVVQHELNSIYDTVVRAFKYNGTDLDKQVIAVESILTRVTMELQKFCLIFGQMLLELNVSRDSTEGEI